jgi:acyl-CoA thioester hydrolase
MGLAARRRPGIVRAMSDERLVSGLFQSGRVSVQPEWIDYNGHMNVGYYVVAFDRASDGLCDHLGCGDDYHRRENGSIFVVEAHVTYEREVREGDPLAFTTQVLDVDEKRLHLIHFMRHADEGFLAATNELMMVHVDMGTRRTAPFPASVRARADALLEAQRDLPRPSQVGRIIGIRRKG